MSDDSCYAVPLNTTCGRDVRIEEMVDVSHALWATLRSKYADMFSSEKGFLNSKRGEMLRKYLNGEKRASKPSYISKL